MGRGDRGQAAITTVLMATVVFVVVIAALATLGTRVVERARAQSIADAAALGSVSGSRVMAERLVGAQRATLVSWVADAGGDTVTVVVRVGEMTATARATRQP